MAGATLADVTAYGPGFVAVGAAADAGSRRQGGIWTTSDGSDWQSVGADRLADAHLQAIARAGDGVNASGQRCSGTGGECIGLLLWGTSDPKTWDAAIEPAAGDSAIPIALASRGPLFVSIDAELVDLSTQTFNGVVYTSPDGDVWTKAPDIAAMHSSRPMAIAASADRFVVVGTATLSSGRNGAAWTSTDGSSWTRASDDPSFAGATLAGVVEGGPGFVAVGSIGANGAVWTSTDGTTWKHVDDGGAFTGKQLVDVAAAGKGLVIVGNDTTGGHAWTSTDGASWHDVGSIPGSDTGKFVSVAIGVKNVAIMGRTLPGTNPAGLVWLGPLPG